MSVTAIPFGQLSSEMRSYLTERAGKYDYYTARDLWSDIPSELHYSEDAMMSFLRGNDALALEPREIMHQVSEFNGGLDVPENLMLGPRSLNRRIGADNMDRWDIEQVESLNFDAVEAITEADPDLLVEAWGSVTSVASTAAAATQTAEVVSASTEALTPIESAGELLGELGGTLLEGFVPAMAAYKVGSYVHDNCYTPDVDPMAASLLAAGGTVLLYVNPVTGPVA